MSFANVTRRLFLRVAPAALAAGAAVSAIAADVPQIEPEPTDEELMAYYAFLQSERKYLAEALWGQHGGPTVDDMLRFQPLNTLYDHHFWDTPENADRLADAKSRAVPVLRAIGVLPA